MDAQKKSSRYGKRERLRELGRELAEAAVSCGFPEELGEMIASSLGTEKTMERMILYMKRTRPRNPAELVDEMLAVKEEFEGYRKKKITQYYNEKLNRLMNEGLDDTPDDIPEG